MERYDAPHGPLSTTRLANGLTVVAQRDPALRGLHVHLRYDVGSRHEAPGHHGLAHFLEHLMFLGTRRHPDFLETLRRAGARDVNASTNQDRSAFTMTVPSELLPLALAMEADRMTNLAREFDERALAGHLALVRREERERCRGPFGDAARLLFEHAYPPGHPYRHPSMGDTDALGRLSPEEVARFHRLHYRPERAGGTPPRVYALLHTPPYGAREHPAYAVLAAVLGLGRGSRLFRSAVRGARIARPAGELLASWELERGSSLLYGAVAATPGTTGARLLDGVRTALTSVSGGLAPRELQRAVRLVRWQRLAGLDDPARRAEAFAVHTRVTGGAHHAYTAAEAVADVTEQAVVHAAGRSTAAATFLVCDEAGTVAAETAR